MDAPRIHHEAKTQSRWALSRQNRRSMGMSVEPEGGSNPRPADYEPAPLCVVGDLWCCLIPACTVVARCSCWAVTARDCQYRDSGYTTDARRQHHSVVVAQWTPPAVVDRHKGGELAERRICLGVLRGELDLGWEPTWHLSELCCPPSVRASRARAMDPLDHRSPLGRVSSKDSSQEAARQQASRCRRRDPQ